MKKSTSLAPLVRALTAPVIAKQNPTKLPRVTINGERYFKDARLREYRNVENPHDRIRFGEIECLDCDPDNPHTKTEGQRRTTCDACGSESHWLRASYRAEYHMAVFDEAETAIDMELPDDYEFRMTLCCYGVARHDVPKFDCYRPAIDRDEARCRVTRWIDTEGHEDFWPIEPSTTIVAYQEPGPGRQAWVYVAMRNRDINFAQRTLVNDLDQITNLLRAVMNDQSAEPNHVFLGR